MGKMDRRHSKEKHSDTQYQEMSYSYLPLSCPDEVMLEGMPTTRKEWVIC